ncbi:MAG: hypothetical protein CMM54_08195 [Rhodospirillaceae bacterium]|nr:hypothetical protein [Rhodospirillaceae bacterium]
MLSVALFGGSTVEGKPDAFTLRRVIDKVQDLSALPGQLMMRLYMLIELNLGCLKPNYYSPSKPSRWQAEKSPLVNRPPDFLSHKIFIC